jgi:hypothetical protein
MSNSFPLNKGDLFRHTELLVGSSLVCPYISLYIYYKFHKLLEEFSDYMVSIDTIVPPPVTSPSRVMALILTLISGGTFLGIWLGGIISDYNSILKFYEDIDRYRELAIP